MDTKYVYEVRDISNDEIYYPIGIFLNLDDAKKQILEFEKGHCRLAGGILAL